jgi:hypothetical protein
MYIDASQKMSDEQAVTASAASTNIIDLGTGGKGAVDQDLIVLVDEAATASGSATVTIALQSDDNAAFSSATTVFTTAAIGKAALTLNSVAVKVRISHITERYVRVYYTVATGPLTAGKFTACLVNNAQADGISS